MLKKIALAAFVLVVILLVAGVAAFLYADRMYELRAAPRVAHQEHFTATYPLRVIVDPREVSEELVPFIQDTQPNINERLLNLGLPYEVALLGRIDRPGQGVKLDVFVNDQRFGPMLAETIEANLAQMSNADGVVWNDTGVERPQRGIIAFKGFYPPPSRAFDAYMTEWPNYRIVDPVALEGGHFIEAVADNRNGFLFLLFNIVEQEDLDDFARQMLTNTLRQLGYVHLTADPTGADALAVRLVMQPTEEAGRPGAESLLTFLSLGFPQLQEALRTAYGIEVQGAATLEGGRVVGEYTVRSLDAMLGRLFAPQSGP